MVSRSTATPAEFLSTLMRARITGLFSVPGTPALAAQGLCVIWASSLPCIHPGARAGVHDASQPSDSLLPGLAVAATIEDFYLLAWALRRCKRPRHLSPPRTREFSVSTDMLVHYAMAFQDFIFSPVFRPINSRRGWRRVARWRGVLFLSIQFLQPCG